MPIDLTALHARIHTMLHDDVIPFWMRHSLDHEHGGYLTCLDRDGSLYGTDKSIWMQGRQIWMLSTLHTRVRPDDAWLAAARMGADFLARHGFDRDGRMYFTVTRDGRPLRKRRYLFSESFAVIALAALARALRDIDPDASAAHAERAREIFRLMLHYLATPGLLEPKIIPTTRRVRSLAMPMILVSTAQELRGLGGDDTWLDAVIAENTRIILEDHARPAEAAVFENIPVEGFTLDGPMARTLNPGHAIEAAWFLLREARERGDAQLRDRACQMLDWTLARGWDQEHGGFFAFQDSEGRPPERLEWDMKLWWPHTEALIATCMAWRDTGRTEYLEWMQRIWDYSVVTFADPEYGEWFGYAHRDGSRANALKGSLWKGMFHVPRALWWCDRLLAERDEA